MSLSTDVCGWVMLATGLAMERVLIARPKFSAEPPLPYVTVRVNSGGDERGDEEMIRRSNGVRFVGTGLADVEIRAFGAGSYDLLDRMKYTRKRPDIAEYLKTHGMGPENFGIIRDLTKLDSSLYESQHIRTISMNYNFDHVDETVDIVSAEMVHVSGNLLRSESDEDPLPYEIEETV